jgi:hypothetical protein
MTHQSYLIRYIIAIEYQNCRDCEIHQHKRPIYTFIICYIRMIVFVRIVQILMFYNVISFSHQFPDGLGSQFGQYTATFT